MAIARRMARFNRLATNRVQGLWAWLIPPWAIIVHTGRKSGKTYRTPVVTAKRRDQLAVALPYGDDTDWVKNLLAAGGGEVIRGGRRRPITEPSVLERGDAALPTRLRRTVLPTRKVFLCRVGSGS
jgi:deazaflavin-dependent oxidoreductase (nitroreductase family)